MRHPSASPSPASAPIAAARARPLSLAPSRRRWKGAPEVTSGTGFSFKPRGRLQLDTATANAPDGVSEEGLGVATEIRRAFLDGRRHAPGRLRLPIEADLRQLVGRPDRCVLTYKPSDGFTLTVGQHKPFGGLEELTSDLFTSMLERAAPSTSRSGSSAASASAGLTSGGDLLVQVGVFSGDNAEDLIARFDQQQLQPQRARGVQLPRSARGRPHLGALGALPRR